MTTVYPSNIDNNTSLPQTIDLKTPVKAEIVNNLREAIIAVENELGIDPSSTYGTVRARLDDMQRSIGNAGSPVDIQENGTTIVSEVEILNFSGGVSIVAGTGKTANIFISGGDGYRPIYEQLPLTTNGQTAFTLTHLPIDSSLVLLFISGIKRQYNVDYTVSGADITYNNDPPLVVGTDVVDVLYFIEQSGGGGGGVGSDLTPPTIAENGNVAIANNEDLSYLAGSNPGDVLSWDGYAWISQAATGGSVETITTIELDTNLVLKPDGYGGVVWGADEGVASLMEVLSIGNITDGYNIEISSGDKLIGETNLILESLDGYVGLYASDGVAGNPVYIVGGDSTGSYDGGSVQIISGNPPNSSYKTGFVKIISNNSNNYSGAVSLLSGNQTNPASGGGSGAVSVKSGDMYGGGTSGNVTLATGAHVTPSTVAGSGNMVINTGNISGSGGSTGYVSIYSGNGTNAFGGTSSGIVSIFSGNTASNGSTGSLRLGTGNMGGYVPTGTITISSGDAGISGATGEIEIISGEAAGANASGNILLTVGPSSAGTGGNIRLTTGRGSSLTNDGYFTIAQRNVTNYWPKVAGTSGQSLCTTAGGSLYWGAPALSKVLAAGNTTDGYNIIISKTGTGDRISFAKGDGYVVDLYNGGYANELNIWNSYFTPDTSPATSPYYTFGSIARFSGVHVSITGATKINDDGDGINWMGGFSTNGNGGGVNLYRGHSINGGGGDFYSGGGASTNGTGGVVNLTGGDSANNHGGDIFLSSGNGGGTSHHGGYVWLSAGNGTGGADGGYAALYGGDGYNGGEIYIRSGESSFGAGGQINITSGTGTTKGGDIEIATHGGDLKIYSDSYTYGDGYFSGKLTVTGLIDPTGLVLDNQATTPGGNPASGKTTIWVRASDNHLVYTNSSGTITDVSVSSGGLTAPTTPAQDGYVTIASGGDLTYLAGTNINDVLSWNGSAWISQASSGGAGTLKQTLSLGNVTDGYDIIISNGDVIEFGSDVIRPTIQFDADNSSFNILSGKSNNGNSDIMIRIADTEDGEVYSSVGSIILYGGHCYVSGDGYSGGGISVSAGGYYGTATNSVGGNLNLSAGSSYSSGAGSVGGFVNITAGLNESPANVTAGTPGGNVVIQGGKSSDGWGDGYEGGRIELTGGDKGLDGFQPAFCGSVNIRGGDCDGIPGNVTITGGDTASASSVVNGGNVTIQGGISINGAGGNVILQGGTGYSSGEVQILGDGYISGKLTVLGLIDPTGLVLDTQSSVPGGTPSSGKATLWVRESDGYAILTNSSGTNTVLSGGGSSPGSASETVIDGYLTSNQNDYSPTGWSTATHIRLSSSAGFDITGFASVSAPSTRYIVNVGSYNLTLKHNSGSSSTGNKLKIPGGIDFVLEPDDVATIWKDPTSNVWRIL